MIVNSEWVRAICEGLSDLEGVLVSNLKNRRHLKLLKERLSAAVTHEQELMEELRGLVGELDVGVKDLGKNLLAKIVVLDSFAYPAMERIVVRQCLQDFGKLTNSWV